MKTLVAAVLAVLALAVPAAAQTFLVSAVPSTNQIGNYSRPLVTLRFPADTPFPWTWEYQTGRANMDSVSLRVQRDDNAANDVTVGSITIGTSRRAKFTLTLPAGRYAVCPVKNLAGPSVTPLCESIVVGAPPLEGGYWSCRTRFENQYAQSGSGPCAYFSIPAGTTPDTLQIPTVALDLPLATMGRFPQTKMLAEEFAKKAWLYDLTGYAKSKRYLTKLPNPTETYAAGWFPTYFRSSIYGTRIPLTEGDSPIARFGHVAKAIPHPQGRGFYTFEINGRAGLLETTGKFTTFFGYQTKNAKIPHYSELTVSPVASDKEFARQQIEYKGDWGTVPRGMLRVWGAVMWPSPAPHDKGLHQGLVADTYRQRILSFDHRTQHAHDDPEGPGPGGQTKIGLFLGETDKITRPCGDHPWDMGIDWTRPQSDVVYAAHADGRPVYTRYWLYWTVRGGSPSIIGGQNQPYDPGTARICRGLLNLADATLVGEPEVFLESAYPQDSETAITALTGGEWALDGPARAQKRFPEFAPVAEGEEKRPGFILPNAMGVTSDGQLWFVEQCASRMRMVDLDTREVTTRRGKDPASGLDADRRWLGKPRHCNEITADLDVHGVLGPKDTLYGGTYGVDSDFVVHPDGSTRRFLPWTGITPSPGDLGPGPMHQTIQGLIGNYQWNITPGNPALPGALVSHQAVGGQFLVMPRASEQGNLDRAKLDAGYQAWKSSSGGKPAPSLLCSLGGFNALPNVVCFPELGTWPEAKALDYIKATWGKTDAQAAAIRYVAVQAMRHKRITGGVPPPPEPPTITVSASVTWGTSGATECGDKPTAGTAPLQPGQAFTIRCSGPGGVAEKTVTLTP